MTTDDQQDGHLEVLKGRWYPIGPPMLPRESLASYTDRLIGALGEERRPYDHGRNRQCSIGYHEECSDRDHSGRCGCPCHEERRNAAERVAEWNRRVPVGTVVAFIAEDEPPEPTAGEAFVDDRGWPVVQIRGFEHPTWLSWFAGAQP